MKFGIIAAGLGSRLASEGSTMSKPMVRICGEPMIDRLIRIFASDGADEIVIISRTADKQLQGHLTSFYNVIRDGELHKAENALAEVPVRLLVKETPSSMHSFYEISKYLSDDVYCVTTTDTVFSEQDFSAYVGRLRDGNGADGVFGITPYIDDESPLYVSVSDDRRILGFYDERADCQYVSAGIYGFRSSAIDILEDCIAKGIMRMRSFQRALISDGRNFEAFVFPKVIDVDHISDIAKAEAMLYENKDGHSC